MFSIIFNKKKKRNIGPINKSYNRPRNNRIFGQQTSDYKMVLCQESCVWNEKMKVERYSEIFK